MPAVKAALGNDLRLLWSAKSNGNVSTLYAVQDQSGRGKAKLDGKSIVDARVGYDEIGDVVCNMTMNGEGAGIWGQMTKAAAADNNQAVAVVLDKPGVLRPERQQRHPQRTLSDQLRHRPDRRTEAHRGRGPRQPAQGRLPPCPARIVDEVSVGPQLGEENIQAGLSFFVFALLVVLVYMIFYYRGAGVVSNIALIANLFFLIGALASSVRP